MTEEERAFRIAVSDLDCDWDAPLFERIALRAKYVLARLRSLRAVWRPRSKATAHRHDVTTN